VERFLCDDCEKKWAETHAKTLEILQRMAAGRFVHTGEETPRHTQESESSKRKPAQD
jgi:hypothetical protein